MEGIVALDLEDFRNPMFDRQKIVRHRVRNRAFKGELAIEGTTVTDDFNEVGFTYYEKDGLLSVKNTDNTQLFLGTIATADEFEKALKTADAKLQRQRRSPFKAAKRRR